MSNINEFKTCGVESIVESLDTRLERKRTQLAAMKLQNTELQQKLDDLKSSSYECDEETIDLEMELFETHALLRKAVEDEDDEDGITAMDLAVGMVEDFKELSDYIYDTLKLVNNLQIAERQFENEEVEREQQFTNDMSILNAQNQQLQQLLMSSDQ